RDPGHLRTVTVQTPRAEGRWPGSATCGMPHSHARVNRQPFSLSSGVVMPLLRAGAALVAVLMVAACGSEPPPPAGPSVVASTDVYGAVASAVGGPGVS